MALYYIEEVSYRKDHPKRFITERRGHYFWSYRHAAKKYTPSEMLAAIAYLGNGAGVLQPTLVEVEHEPT